jgi:predicted RNase H-like nuclease (RuvC/YqgF family)
VGRRTEEFINVENKTMVGIYTLAQRRLSRKLDDLRNYHRYLDKKLDASVKIMENLKERLEKVQMEFDNQVQNDRYNKIT